jgi:NAD(P)-dependent dehydrogenase (short-subunit alcohol dehydrogenase family)
MSTTSSSPAAFITGGTTGIGHATARVLHAAGFGVLVTGRNPETLAEARRSLPDEVAVLRADLRSIADAQQVADELKQRFGKLDLAFLNAGFARVTPLETLDEAVYDELFDVNVKGHLFTLKAILPLLGPGSSVVFNSSTVGKRGVPGQLVYSATKGAVNSLTRSLAVELAPKGIRVNAVSPGPVDTPAQDKLGQDLPAGRLEAFKQQVNGWIPMGRFGSAEEIARTVAFLASPAAGFITGTTIDIDGGMAAQIGSQASVVRA